MAMTEAQRVELAPMDYHSVPALSGTAIKYLLRSAAHYRAYVDTPREATPAMLLGSAIHVAVLEPEKFEAEVVCAPDVDRRTKAGKEAWEAFQQSSNGRYILTPEQWETCQRVRDAAMAHPAVQELLDGTIRERPLFWRDAEHNIICKGRPDAAAADWSHVIDLKSTQDARPSAFQRSMASFGYHIQLAHYLSGILHQENVEPMRVYFLAVETEPPYGIRAYVLAPESLYAAKVELEHAYRLYAQCIATGQWPAYGYEISTITLPAWALNTGD